MAIIRCEGIGRSQRIADKQPGLASSLRHLLKHRIHTPSPDGQE